MRNEIILEHTEVISFFNNEIYLGMVLGCSGIVKILISDVKSATITINGFTICSYNNVTSYKVERVC